MSTINDYQPKQQENYKGSKQLPHLPKGVRIPRLHGHEEKPLPKQLYDDDGNSMINNQLQLILPPGQDLNDRRELQPYHSTSFSKNNQDIPPPIFASQPKKRFSLKRPTQVQQHIYRMSGGIEPVDLLCDRLNVWRLAIRDLIDLFKHIIDIEAKSADGYAISNKALNVPFRESNNQFIEMGGIQDVWTAYRNYTVEKSVMHHEYVNYLRSSVVPSLKNLKDDIKTFVKSIGKDPRLRSSILYNSRQEADHMINRLDGAIKYAYHSPDLISPLDDPTLLNLGVIQAFKKLYNEENNLHENVVQLQREVATVEQRIFGSINIITKNWEQFCINHRMEYQPVIGKVTATFNDIQTNADWNEFVRRNQFQLVNEKATYKSEKSLKYPNQQNDLCIPTKVNFLNKKNLLRKWQEGLYVLTPCGYLHGFKSAKHFETDPLSPEISIFLPHTEISATEQQADEFAFQISHHGRKRGGIRMDKNKYVFQANDHDDLADWYKQTSILAARNAIYQPLDLEDVLPSLPGLEADERENNQQRLITGPSNAAAITAGTDDGLANDQNEEKIQKDENEDEEDHTEAPLSTASVLPDNMIHQSIDPTTSSSPSTPPPSTATPIQKPQDDVSNSTPPVFRSQFNEVLDDKGKGIPPPIPSSMYERSKNKNKNKNKINSSMNNNESSFLLNGGNVVGDQNNQPTNLNITDYPTPGTSNGVQGRLSGLNKNILNDSISDIDYEQALK